MAIIGILGAGHVARALATGWAAAGHQVVVGVRRSTPPGWTVAPHIRTAPLAEAAAAAEVVVNALPGDVAPDLLAGLAPALAGRILLDVANAVDTDALGFAVALRHAPLSLAETLQAALPETRVVKALNTMHESVMAAPARLAALPSAFLSGDDPAAKATIAALLADLGWSPAQLIDLGDVHTARVPEAFILLVGPLVRALGPVPFALSVAR